MNWKKFKEEKPSEGEEVLAYHPSWIDEDFNPRGIRIGFWNGGDDFKSAHWWDYQDCYITISHCDCDDNSLFSDRIKNSIEPELWISLDVITNYLPDIKQNHLSQISLMTEEEQQKEVAVWGENMNLMKDCSLEKTDEDLYYNTEWDYTCEESELEPEDKNDPDVHKVYEAGMHYIYSN